MKRCKILVALCVVSVVLPFLNKTCPAFGAARTIPKDFAVFCSDAPLDAIQNALDSGAKPTEQALITAAYANPNPEVIKLLITSAQRYGLDITKVPVTGATVLNSAIRGGRVEVVRAVMSFGVNINARDKSYRSPLNEALRYGVKSTEPERHEIIRLLRRAGAKR